MKKPSRSLALAGLVLCFGFTAQAQDDQAMMKQIEHDNQAALDAIALYPTDTRKDILEASKYPEIVVRLNAMQKQSRDLFTEMLAPYSHEEQEKIWNLTRYPALISELAYDHRKSEAEIADILVRYPEDIHRTAQEEAIVNYTLLVQIDRSNADYLANLDRTLQSYPRVTGSAYRDLIKQPDVLSTLYDNMQMTVVLGDIYKTDPQYALYETDSLNQVLTAQNAQAAQDWQQSLNSNPQAQAEYSQAAEEYAQENGYSQEEYTAPVSPDVANYTTYPYNWWFGYPTWYTTPCWDPYPFWYDWGFYYGPGHHAVYFGMPSYHFMNWYFYNPDHCRRYPEFGNHCYGYYSNHRDGRYSNSVSRGVNDWRRRNKDVVTKDWDTDRTGRAQRFKEYGQLETERASYNHSHPDHPMERKAYLEQNQSRYPHTTAVAVVNTHATNRPNERSLPQQQAPAARPHATIPASYYKNAEQSTPTGSRGSEQNRNSSTEQPRVNPQPGNSGNGHTPAPVQSHTNPPARPISNQTRDAQQYHQSTWQEAQPQQHYSPPARSEPASRPAPANSGGGGHKK